MKKLLTLILASSVLAMPISAYAASVGVSTTGTASGAGVTGSATASTSASTTLTPKSTFPQLMASLSSDTSATTDIGVVGPKTRIHIVKLSSLKGYAAGKASLSSTLNSDASIKTLDASIAASAELTAKLKAAGYTPDQVVAASSTKTSLTLFVNDKA